MSLDVPETAGTCDSAQLWTDLHLPQRLDTVPVNRLEVLTVRRQHGRNEEALVSQVLHDRVGDRNSVSTRVDATRETVAITAGLSEGGVVRAFGSGSVALQVIAEILPPKTSSSRGVPQPGSS